VKSQCHGTGATLCARGCGHRPFDLGCSLFLSTNLLVDHLDDADLFASGLDWAMPLRVQGCCIAARCRCSERRAIGT
jgi:hypothetical protein